MTQLSVAGGLGFPDTDIPQLLLTNHRPVFRSRDLSQPITGQYSGHVICLDQWEASIVWILTNGEPGSVVFSADTFHPCLVYCTILLHLIILLRSTMQCCHHKNTWQKLKQYIKFKYLLMSLNVTVMLLKRRDRHRGGFGQFAIGNHLQSVTLLFSRLLLERCCKEPVTEASYSFFDQMMCHTDTLQWAFPELILTNQRPVFCLDQSEASVSGPPEVCLCISVYERSNKGNWITGIWGILTNLSISDKEMVEK